LIKEVSNIVLTRLPLNTQISELGSIVTEPAFDAVFSIVLGLSGLHQNTAYQDDLNLRQTLASNIERIAFNGLTVNIMLLS